jgi:class 3 adenylate cyclase/tetratricopeptide (TPR) repeat protein
LQAERRQITVVFCDLVRSTPLSVRLDLEELAEVIGAYQAKVTAAVSEFGGYVARFVGDGVFSYFGWPKSEETNSELAVRAALSIVTAMDVPIHGEKLSVRVAVTTGTVVVGGTIGTGESWAPEAIGETPNLAARLQEIAEPDSVVIDDVTRRQIEGLFTVQDLGERALTGYRTPVRAWRVLHERAVDDRFAARRAGRLVPLIARNEELARLLECWRLAKQGKGQLVWLSGEAGIGKSRLIAELLSRLREEPHGTLRYFCSPYYEASPLYPVISRFEYDASFVRGDEATEKLAKLAHLLRWTGASDEDAALIADLVGVPFSGTYPALDLSPQAKKQRTHEALLRQAVATARRAPLLVLGDDAHWADPSSLELLHGFIGLLPELPILLIVSFRPEFVPPFTGAANETRIDLARLGRGDAEQLAKEVTFGRVPPPPLIERIIAQSDGIPLFIEELARSVLETADDAALAGSLHIPDTLQGLLTARLDRLPRAKRVAQIGATIGRAFSLPLLRAVADVGAEEVSSGLDELVASGLAFRRRETSDAVYVFKHALVQEAIYDSLLRRQRAAIHARIVAAAEDDASLGVSEPGLLGYHCARAGLVAKAASYYRIAGGRSAERAAVAETRAHLERGLQIVARLPEEPDRFRLEAELLIALGRILMATKGPNDPEAGSAFQRAVAVCRKLGSPEMLGRALNSLGIVAESRGELDAAQAIGEELQVLSKSSGDAGIAIAGCVRLGVVAYYRGRFVDAHDHLAEALALHAMGQQELRDSAIASDPHVASAYLGVSLAHLGHAAQAVSHGERAVSGARRLGSSSPAYALALSVLSRTLEVLRQQTKGDACARMLVALAEGQGLSFLLAIGHCQLGWSLSGQGEMDKGLALLSQGMTALRTRGVSIRLEMGKFFLADVLARSGRREEALGLVEEVLAFARSTGAHWLDAELHRRKGELLLALADPERAAQSFGKAIDIAREQSAKIFELRAATSLARVWLARGRHNAARETLVPSHAWFDQEADLPDVQDARAVLAELEMGAIRPDKFSGRM